MILSVSRSSLLSPIILTSFILSIPACDSGGGTSSSSGRLNLAVTDAPVDGAISVIVAFSGVTIKPSDGSSMSFELEEPLQIDLLQLQGSLSQGLLEGQEVPAGRYEWVRLDVEAQFDGIMDSYLEMQDGSQIELRVPSGSQSGLKLVNGFSVPAGGVADFTIDFDLRKSVTMPSGQQGAILKPALRMVDNALIGGISGTISSDWIVSLCEDPGVELGAVYLFEGADQTATDVQGLETDPLSSSLVMLLEESYRYEFGFIEPGSYTLAYTCDAHLDDPEVLDSLRFTPALNITLEPNEDAQVDFLMDVTASAEPVI